MTYTFSMLAVASYFYLLYCEYRDYESVFTGNPSLAKPALCYKQTQSTAQHQLQRIIKTGLVIREVSEI